VGCARLGAGRRAGADTPVRSGGGETVGSETEVLKLEETEADREKLRAAGRALRAGRLVAFPTETVWGLGANAADPEALARLAEARGDAERPYTILLSESGEVSRYASEWPRAAAKLARIYWPGPLTIVVSASATSARPTVGLRVPNHRSARALAAEALVPLAAPSANRSGEPPARDAAEVLAAFGDRVAYVLDGGPVPGGRPSSVTMVEGEEVAILREGRLDAGELREAARLTILFVCDGNTCRSPMAEHLCRREIERRTRNSAIRVLSVGMSASSGAPASESAVRVMREDGIEMRAHRSRSLSPALVELADLIFVMEGAHARALAETSPRSAGRVRLLGAFGHDVTDPAGRDLAEYRACRDELEASMKEIVESL